MRANWLDVTRSGAACCLATAVVATLAVLAGCEATSQGAATDRGDLAPPRDNPTTARDFIDEGTFYLGKPGMELRAEASFRKALRLRPTKRMASEAYCGIALSHQKAGNTSKAIKSFQDACKLDPGSATAWTGLASATFEEATREAMLDLAGLRKSVVFANKAVAVDPLHAEAYMWRGRARQLLGEKRLAAADFTTALDIGLRDVWALLVRDQLANAWFDAGEYELAIKQWRLLLRRDDAEDRTKTAWRKMIGVAEAARKQKTTR